MPLWAEHFLKAFIPLFVASDPIGLTAIFLAMSAGVPAAARRCVARQATLTGGVVALAFLFLGRSIFAAIGITVSDFQVAGGIILLVLASRELVLPASTVSPKANDDFGVVPLGMPLIAGPALITTLLVLVDSVGLGMTLLALAANLGLLVAALFNADKLGAWLGATGLRAISKIVALLLAAIAVAMIRRGWAG
jgi:multiple antibiotic resistance protein